MSEGVENERKIFQLIKAKINKTIEREPAVRRKIRSKDDIFMIYLALKSGLPNLLRACVLNLIALSGSFCQGHQTKGQKERD
jgi:hypothetical protein